MAQWFKCLLHKSGPVWIPRICLKVTRCQYLPIVPDLEGKDRAPQSKLASQSSHICQLWACSRSPALMSKVSEQMKIIPSIYTPTHSCIHTCSSTHTHAHKQEKRGKIVLFPWFDVFVSDSYIFAISLVHCFNVLGAGDTAQMLNCLPHVVWDASPGDTHNIHTCLLIPERELTADWSNDCTTSNLVNQWYFVGVGHRNMNEGLLPGADMTQEQLCLQKAYPNMADNTQSHTTGALWTACR